MQVRKLVRQILTWFFVGVILVIAVSVVGEWVIHVADDKCWYENAGKHWDDAVSAVLAFMASPLPPVSLSWPVPLPVFGWIAG